MKKLMSAADWIAGGHHFQQGEGRSIFYRRAGRGGQTLVMLHGFPTWSYDYAAVAADLATGYDIITPDFLGYGASDKPRDHRYTVSESADIIEALLLKLSVKSVHLVIHDYGGIVGQELLDRRLHGRLSFDVQSVHVMNCGVVYEAYRPVPIQRLLSVRWLGKVIASLITKNRFRAGLNAVRGPTHQLSDDEFEQLWHGVALHAGHKLAHRHIKYNAERALHAERWLSALKAYEGPLQLIWGMADPVSGSHVLDLLRPLVPRAQIDTLSGVGHFPMSEAPLLVAAALRRALE